MDDSAPVDPEANWEAGRRPTQLRSKVRIFFLFALDLGFCLDPSDRSSQDDLLEMRATGSPGRTLLGTGTISLEFAGLRDGKLEKDDIQERTARAKRSGGKGIWAATLLKDEAPYRFPRQPNGDPKIPTGGVHFDRGEQAVRIFPRGVLAIEQQYDLDPKDANVEVESFIRAVKAAREQATNDAWTCLREMLTHLQEHPLKGLELKWSPTGETQEAFIRQHLLVHTMIFMDSLPGDQVAVDAHPSFDRLGEWQRSAVVGILNLTEWFQYYSAHYSGRVLDAAVRNREDEIYVTDNDASVIILANYWLDGDPLKEYQRDLVLATQFELCRLTHLRYLAYYLRQAPQANDATAVQSTPGRDSLDFILRVQKVVSDSGYDHPAESLVQHGFTRRFLARLATERGSIASLKELDEFIDRVMRTLELRTGLDLSEKNVGVARGMAVATNIILILTFIAAVIAAYAALK